MTKKYILHPATFKLDGGAMFGIIPKPLWERKIAPDGFNRINMSLRILLIRSENRNILVDTGVGDYHSDRFNQQFDIQGPKSPLQSVLKEHFNITPDEITDIVLTHLHFDHVGGLGQTLADGHHAIFPNAIIHLHKDHYNYALNPTLRDSGSFQKHYFQGLLNDYKEKSQINFLTGNDGSIIKTGDCDLKFKTSFGHTPYMIHPIIDDLIYMADLVPMSHHIRIPWVMGYDIEPGTTTIYKEKFYKYIISNNLKMIFEHDINIWGGTLAINDKGQYQLKESFRPSSELPFTEI